MTSAISATLGQTADVTWNAIGTSGGGLIEHLSIATDGTIYNGTDVGGAYKWNPGSSSWVQIVTQERLNSELWGGYRQGSGVADIQVALGNSNLVWFTQRDSLAFNHLWKSVDGGTISRITNYPANNSAAWDPNDQSGGFHNRLLSGKIGIDPNDNNSVYAANPGGFPLVTRDGGNTWKSIPTLPSVITTNIGACNWEFDPSGGTIGGRSAVVWVSVYSNGVYRSTDAGETFSLVSSTPQVFSSNSGIDASGNYYFSYDVSGNRRLGKITPSGTLTDIRTGGTNFFSVAVDRSQTGRIAAMQSNGSGGGDQNKFHYSTNAGSTWLTYTHAAMTFNAGDSAWQIGDGAAGTLCNLKFNPASTNDLWLCMGQGILKATLSDPTTPAAPSWTYACKGIEELIINDVTHDVGTKLFVSCWDEMGFNWDKATFGTAPSSRFLSSVGIVKNIWMMRRDPQNLLNCFWCGSASACSGYSTDGLSTTNTFANEPATAHTSTVNYDCIAINNGVCIWVPAASATQKVYRSTDFGASAWSVVTLGGAPTTGDTGWQDTIQTPKEIVTPDRVDPNTFYISNRISGPRGVWKSTDAGVTWVQGTQPYSSTAFYIRIMKAVPGNQGHLFATCGHNTPTSPNTKVPVGGTVFGYSVDGGANWNSVPNVAMVNAFGFGAVKNVGDYPTIYFAGFVNEVFGIYRIDNCNPVTGDFSRIVKLLGSSKDRWAGGTASATLDGDKDIWGRCYNGPNYCDLS